jgi:formate-dependent nitrite reductase membrane component NrfD
VIVCPTRAIVRGDLDDPSSEISRMVAQQKVAVRKPEKGTEPKLFYVGIESDLLAPARLRQSETYFWSDRRDDDAFTETAGTPDWGGWARETYDVPHPAPWGWKIAAYLWTKSISAGIIMIAAAALALFPSSPLLRAFAPAIALAMLAATLALLVLDLKRPDRFYYLITKPNLHSWLVLGSYILMAYGAALLAWLFYGLRAALVPPELRFIAALLGAAGAAYSAFLFAQAKGRDLWQSPFFFWHLLVHALIAGAAALIVAASVGHENGRLGLVLSEILATLLLISFVMNIAELALPHISYDVSLAMHALTRGSFRHSYWGVAIGLGIILPALLIALVAFGAISQAWSSLSALLALNGIWWFDVIWVKAGQIVPLS